MKPAKLPQTRCRPASDNMNLQAWPDKSPTATVIAKYASPAPTPTCTSRVRVRTLRNMRTALASPAIWIRSCSRLMPSATVVARARQKDMSRANCGL